MMLCRSGKCSEIAMRIHVTCWNTASSYVLVVWMMVRLMVVFGANVVRLGCKVMFLVDFLPPPMVAHVLVSGFRLVTLN